MFTFILFLAVIVIFIWAKNRFYELEQHLEGLERKLKELRTAPKPAQEAIPVKPAPSAPCLRKRSLPQSHLLCRGRRPRLRLRRFRSRKPLPARLAPSYASSSRSSAGSASLHSHLLLRCCRHGKCRSSTGKISLA